VHDIAMSVTPEVHVAHVGERLWVNVSATNVGSTPLQVVVTSTHGLAINIDSAPDSNWQLRGALPGTGPSGYQTDGDHLPSYLAHIPTMPFFEAGRPQHLLGRVANDSYNVEAFHPGESLSARFAIDVGASGPLPVGGIAFLNASLDLGAPHNARVASNAPITVAERADRLSSWPAAVRIVGSDPTTVSWLVNHQGPMSENWHGCEVSVRYWHNEWEFTFFENVNVRRDPTSKSPGRPERMLRVRTDASGVGTVLEVRELTIGLPASDDPDASGAHPDREVLLFPNEVP
jgi:hypothetical protein